jgi:hypothetical protein
MMEQSVFPLPAVAGELQHFVEARLHADSHDPEHRARIAVLIETMARTVAQPVFVALDPKTGAELGRYRGAALLDSHIREFVEFLQLARQKAVKA